MRSEQWTARPRNLVPGGIHDDASARALGFAGGFVPGVALYEHIVNALIGQGEDWLRLGHVVFERFRRPVYDGEEVRFTIDAATGAFSVASPDGSDERARGLLSIDAAAPSFIFGEAENPPQAPLGDPAQVGRTLELRVATDPERLRAVEQAQPGFIRRPAGGVEYPVGLWLNPIDLVRTYFAAPVTIHVAGEVWHHNAPLLGETIVKRGRITSFSERNGNRSVHFDVAVATADGRPLATIRHQSVFQLARSEPGG
jgi:hypothetical protein